MAMRNPVERAYSFYRSRAPHEHWKDIKDAIGKDGAIISRGQYIEQVDLLLRSFDRDNILFLFYDDLKADERSYLKQVFTFLGVDPSFEPTVLGNPVRAAMFPGLRRRLARMGLTPLVNRVNRSWVGDLIRRALMKWRKTAKTPPRIPSDALGDLQTHFHPYNEQLSKSLGRNLDSWNAR